MTRLTTVCAGFLLATTFSFNTAFAQDNEPGSGPNPFTDCGIGAALFPDTHWAAVTSNVIWDIGTTAVISATASPETCEGASAQAARFINDAYDSVVEDTARGEGDHLSALLQIYGCSNDAQSDIVSSVRSEVGDIVSAADYAEKSRTAKAEDYFKVIDGRIQSDFAASCSA